MVATIAKAASAGYYIESQASHRPVDEYYTGGEEPDGVWWNPSGLFSREDGGTDHGRVLDSADFYKLYNGFDPTTGEKLTQNAGSENRCAGYDLTFNADKTVSSLWAIAPSELRTEIENLHNEAVRVALEDTIQQHCSYTRIRESKDGMTVVPADIMAALFQHGAARSNDPHLHTHCVILNVARAHHDGKWRALHGGPLFKWQKAAGAVYRAEIASLLATRLGIEMETHGDENQYTRVKQIPEELVQDWSKRNGQIRDTAARFGIDLNGKGAMDSAIHRMTRAPKGHGVHPEARHASWIEEAQRIGVEPETVLESIAGQELETTEQQRIEINERLDALPNRMTEMEAVFKYTNIVEQVSNASGGILTREERKEALARFLENEHLIELDRPDTSHDAGERLAHSRVYTSADNLKIERDIDAYTRELVASSAFGIADAAVSRKIERLSEEGYPISGEQETAIRNTAAPGQITIIEGAAGSGKTTTLRPIADLYREQGYKVIGTAVAWRVTLELGNDLDAPHHCVQQLINRIAKGTVDIDRKTVIFVDEAGMLSSAHARKILQIAKERGAKIVFAGDTQQQQSVTAGPGLRLIRDIADSTRVDTIRRQLPDLEDMLVATRAAAPDTAHLAAAAATPEQQQQAVEAWRALPTGAKAAVRPWQVVASEAFRDKDAPAAIAAYDKRGRFHIERDLDRTLTRLIDDWDAYRLAEPGKSFAVIAQSNAETKALAFLMRERILADYDGPRVVVQACRRRNAEAKPESLEIANGDILRIGTTNWKKGLVNGTIVTVLDVKQVPSTSLAGEPRARIRARTNHGRIVEFHHDEISDYHGKIRLDYGYTHTMTSAQGMTVDRAFVFANQTPARETIYPACTRHRERLDIYIDRKPAELDIREQRNEELAGEPVTDEEIKAYLGKRWSREDQKEAASDYMTEEMKHRVFQSRRPPADPRNATPERWLASHDPGTGLLSRLASRIRYSAIRIQHASRAQTVGPACRKLNASFAEWIEARGVKSDAAIAVDPAFRIDLHDAAALLRSAKPFLGGDPVHTRILEEHGGISVSDLEALANARRLAVSMRDNSTAERRQLDPLFVPATMRKTPAGAAMDPDDLDPFVEPLELPPPDISIDTAPPEDLWDGLDQLSSDDYDRGAEIPIDDYLHDDPDIADPLDAPLDPGPPQYADRPYDGEIPASEIVYDQAQPPPADPRSAPAAPPGSADYIQRVRAFAARASEIGIPTYAAAGMTALLDEARELLKHPELEQPDRTRIEAHLGAAGEWLVQAYDALATQPGDPSNAQQAPSVAYADYLARARATAERATSIGLPPFATASMRDILDEARELLGRPDLDEAQRADLEAGLRNFASWSAAQAVPPSPQSAADAHAAHATRIQELAGRATRAGIPRSAGAGARQLDEDGRALLRHPDLPEAARAAIERDLHAFHDWNAAARAALAAAPHDPSAQRPIGDIHGDYAARLRIVTERAAAIGIPPAAASGMSALVDDGQRLLDRPDLPEAARAAIQTAVVEFFDWETAALAALAATPAGAPQPDPGHVLYADYAGRVSDLAQTAASIQIPPPAAAGMRALVDEGRRLLQHPDLLDAQRANIENPLREFAAWEAGPAAAHSARPIDVNDNRYALRFTSLDNRAEALSVPPFAAPAMRALLAEGRELLQNPGLREPHRIYIQRTLTQHKTWVEESAATAPLQPDIAPEPDTTAILYLAYRERLDGFLTAESQLAPGDYSFIEQWDAIKHEGRALLDLLDIPEASRTYIDQRVNVERRQIPTRDQARPLPGLLPPRLEGLIAAHAALVQNHKESARSAGREPHQMPGTGHLDNAASKLEAMARANTDVRAPAVEALHEIYRARIAPGDEPSQTKTPRQTPAQQLTRDSAIQQTPARQTPTRRPPGMGL